MPDLPLMGFGTFIGLEADAIADQSARENITQNAIVTALKNGYRHLDLAENYHNLAAVRAALTEAFKPIEEGGLGLAREDIWLTMKAVCPYSEQHTRKRE